MQNSTKIPLLIKKSNKNSNFIVFISPLSQPFLDTISQDKRLRQYYFDWISTLIEVFEEVYTFSMPNKYVIDYHIYSLDGDHFYPIVGIDFRNYFKF